MKSEVISYGTAVKFNLKSKTLILGFYFLNYKNFLCNIAYYIWIVNKLLLLTLNKYIQFYYDKGLEKPFPWTSAVSIIDTNAELSTDFIICLVLGSCPKETIQ